MADAAMTSADKLRRWHEIKTQIKNLSEEEKTLRAEIVKAYFPQYSPGTNRVDVGSGWNLKAIIPTTITVPSDDAARNALQIAVDKLKTMPDGVAKVGRLLKWKLEVSTGEWSRLSEEEQRLFTGGKVAAVHIADGSPQVDLEPPK